MCQVILLFYNAKGRLAAGKNSFLYITPRVFINQEQLISSMLEVRTIFRPYRMKLSRKEPVEMTLTITNHGPGIALTSFEMTCDRELSFDKGGYKNSANASLGELAVGQKHETYFDLHSKPITRPGAYQIKVKATEHFNSYNLIKKEYTKTAEIVVEE